MTLSDVVIAAGLLLLVCVLAGAGPGWDVAGAGTVDGYRWGSFCLAAGAATLAVLLAEHDRRASARSGADDSDAAGG